MAQVGALLQRSGDAGVRAGQPVGADLRPRPRRRALRRTSSARSWATSWPTRAPNVRAATGSSPKGVEHALRADADPRPQGRAGPDHAGASRRWRACPCRRGCSTRSSTPPTGSARDARVEGALTLRQDGAKDWEAEFQGNLLDIDLAELVGRRFPTTGSSGKARLAVASARWADRPGQGYGWVEAEGELTAGPGLIGFGLLQR